MGPCQCDLNVVPSETLMKSMYLILMATITSTFKVLLLQMVQVRVSTKLKKGELLPAMPWVEKLTNMEDRFALLRKN